MRNRDSARSSSVRPVFFVSVVVVSFLASVMAAQFTEEIAESALVRTTKEALRAPPGEASAMRRLERFRFTEHLSASSALAQWPLSQLSGAVGRKVRAHGAFPPLGAGRRGAAPPWGAGRPSERIGANFSPRSKSLTVEGMRQWKVDRRAAVKEDRERRKEAVLMRRRKSLPAIRETKAPKLSTPPSPTPPPPVYSVSVMSRRGSLDSSTASGASSSPDTFTSTPPREDGDADDADATDAGAAAFEPESPEERQRRRAAFLRQFPYKSCRRGAALPGEASAPWEAAFKPTVVQPPPLLMTRAQRRAASARRSKKEALDDLRRRGVIRPRKDRPQDQCLYSVIVRKEREAERERLLAAAMRGPPVSARERRSRARDAGRKRPEASQPCSPTRQLELISWGRKRKASREEGERGRVMSGFGLDEEENAKRYWRYVREGFQEDEEQSSSMPRCELTKEECARIESRLRPEWAGNIMMRKLTAKLMGEAAHAHAEASRRCAVDYALMDPEESARVRVRPPPREETGFSSHRSVVRAPVPWHQVGTFFVNVFFCLHTLLSYCYFRDLWWRDNSAATTCL